MKRKEKKKRKKLRELSKFFNFVVVVEGNLKYECIWFYDTTMANYKSCSDAVVFPVFLFKQRHLPKTPNVDG